MPQRKYQRNYKKRRGWTVDARIGKGVPFLGGSGFRIQKRALNGIVKRNALKQEETKKLVTNVNAVTLTHGTLLTLPLTSIPQGVTSSTRTGDKVFYCGLNIKAMITPVSGNTQYRFYVVKHRDSYSSLTNQAFGSGLGSSLMFRNNDVSPNGIINSDSVSVVSSWNCSLNQKFSGESLFKQCSKNIKLMKQFQFRPGTQEGEYYNYYLVVLPWVPVGSPVTGTTTVGYMTTTVEQIYKDA